MNAPMVAATTVTTIPEAALLVGLVAFLGALIFCAARAIGGKR